MENEDLSQYTRPQKVFSICFRAKRYAALLLKSFLNQLFTKSQSFPFTFVGLKQSGKFLTQFAICIENYF